MMELFSPQFFSALFAIVVIDLVLAGDNAIVIALAARGLPPQYQKQTIIWGTVGAIVVRAVMTLGVVWLLKIPGLLLGGGLLLIWIAYRLVVPKDNTHDEHAGSSGSFWGAIKTIVIADAVMGIDNVLGVAGAAHGSFLLVVLGLIISVPIMVFGSSLVLKWIERFPSIIYIGAAILAATAASMIDKEPLFEDYFFSHHAADWALYVFIAGGVLAAGYWRNCVKKTTASNAIAH
jgi:YjbE family integral membrane protein